MWIYIRVKAMLWIKPNNQWKLYKEASGFDDLFLLSLYLILSDILYVCMTSFTRQKIPLCNINKNHYK